MSLEKSNYIFNDEDETILRQISARSFWEPVDITIAAPFIKRNLHLPNTELADLLWVTRKHVENILHRNKIKRSEQQLQAIRERTGKLLTGELNGNWRGGSSNNHYRYKLNQKEKWPERIQARNKVRSAVKSGKLEKETCFICGEVNVNGHHENYEFPIEVVWVCTFHHRVFDQFRATGMIKVKSYFIFALEIKLFFYRSGGICVEHN